MSLYRHVANKDELVVFMLSAAPSATTAPSDGRIGIDALADWADGLWEVYHRHPWILQASSAGPPADPGQLSWLEAGLSALADTRLSERDKFGAVMAVLHFARGAAALASRVGRHAGNAGYSGLLKRLIDRARFPALAAAIEAGVFDGADRDRAGRIPLRPRAIARWDRHRG